MVVADGLTKARGRTKHAVLMKGLYFEMVGDLRHVYAHQGRVLRIGNATGMLWRCVGISMSMCQNIL